jgi:hypothetical protein
MAIFDFLPDIQRCLMQILNKRFYKGIVPNWLHSTPLSLFTDLSTIRFSPDLEDLQPDFQFKEWPPQSTRDEWHKCQLKNL